MSWLAMRCVASVMVTRQAIGPVLIISPSNSPSILGPRNISAALAAGCTIVLKASEQCPKTYRLICQIFAESGLPPGVLNQIVSAREDAAAVTDAIIGHPAVRKVDFIGSAIVGRLIGQTCSKHLKPILMELGGKGPLIVCKDADLEKAASTSAFGAFVNRGQVCMSTERIFVVRDVADEFTKLLKKEVELNWAEGVGSAVTIEAARKARDLLEAALKDGAKILAGDNAFLDRNESSLRPTIVTNMPKNTIMRDTETFGPSATLYIVKDEEEAIELANQSDYGLSGSIWTNDILRGLALSKRLECGMVHVNGSTVGDYPTMAVQDSKGSGWGSNNSTHGIMQFMQTKTVTLQSSSQRGTIENGPYSRETLVG